MPPDGSYGNLILVPGSGTISRSPIPVPKDNIDTWMTDSTLPAEFEPIDTVSIDVPLKQWQPGASPHRV